VEVVVARIGRPHGIKGEVSVEVRTDDPEGRLGSGTVLRTEPAAAGPLTILTGRFHSGRLLLTFHGCTSRSGAERLRNVLLVADVDPDERPEDPDEYFDRQLVGLRVESLDGEEVGELAEMLHLPGQDVLVVRRPDGRESLVPFIADFVPEVDLEGGRVVVDPPEGLLDDLPPSSENGPVLPDDPTPQS
jgi:16S rRNA processing protein RimM